MRKILLYIMVGLLYAILLVGCSSHGRHSAGAHPVDTLNYEAHAWRYRDLDSAAYYAAKAYEKAGRYTHGRAMACNMLGFVAFMQMQYDEALRWYDEVEHLSGCELERLVADVGRMNVYQRMADNLAFYDCRVRAMNRLRHINEESANFSHAEKERLRVAMNDLHMISALHHFLIGQRPEANAEMRKVIDDEAFRTDTAQWLMYMYIKGMGLDVEGDTREQRRLRRYGYLNSCLRASRTEGYIYFEGLALSGLSELLSDSVRMAYIAQHRPGSFAQLADSVDDAGDVSMTFSQDALCCFDKYGDRYSAMNATVQLASLYNRIGEYEVALDILGDSVLLDTADAHLSPWEIAPDPQARRHEELSVAFAGLGNKPASDYHRNQYLDLLETTRQDKETESRYLSLQRRSRTMKVLLYVVVVGVVLFVLLLTVLSRRRRRRGSGYEQQLHELLQEAEKRVYLHRRHVEEGKRDNIVRKASFSMVTGMMPYIDRMAHEVERLQLSEVWDDEAQRARKLAYITELADEINNLNELLSRWIKTTQGMVSLTVESFSLAEVFDMIGRSASSFMMKGLTLEVQPTEAIVKADKALTFFMLNTLADNARKFTPEGGCIGISAKVCEEYVELAVTDNGVGMTSEDIDRVLHEKVYDANTIGQGLSPDWREKKGSGFGLLNCKGIIEKYRKTDTLFEVCRFGIESRVGEGSRFWFRLPKGVRRMLVWLCVVMSSPYLAQSGELTATPMSNAVLPAAFVSVEVDETIAVSAVSSSSSSSSEEEEEEMMEGDSAYSPLLVRASTFADSVYYANVDGRYEEALIYADSAIRYLNAHHRMYAATYIDTLTLTWGVTDVETRWWLSDYATDYHTILDVRNEVAVANLALRRLADYRYNNLIYNNLYKLVSEDRSLIDYCNRMQRYYSNTTVAVALCLLLALGYLIVFVYSFMGRVANAYRHIESVEGDERRVRHEENRLHVQNMVLDNCLSTIKHETVYYPNRIKQLVSRMGNQDERRQMKELIDYYRVTFATLVGCASRQLDEVTFRRTSVPVDVLVRHAAEYHAKCSARYPKVAAITIERCDEVVLCDEALANFLLEQLIDASFVQSAVDVLHLSATPDGDFICMALANHSRTLDSETLQTLFYPSQSRIVDADTQLQGTEYIVCRQIIREHDDHFNHIGCRIKAESTATGYVIWFTLPRVKKA